MTIDAPIAFAHELYTAVVTDGVDDCPAGEWHAPARADYQAALDALSAAVRDRDGAAKLVAALDEAAPAWASDAHGMGIEVGVAAEGFRRELLAGGNGPRIPWLTPKAGKRPTKAD